MQEFRRQAERFGARVRDRRRHKGRLLRAAVPRVGRRRGVPRRSRDRRDRRERTSARARVGAARCRGAACRTARPATPPSSARKHVVVVGGGDSAMEEATFLTRFAAKVTIVHRRDEFRASQIMLDRAHANEKVEFVTPTSSTRSSATTGCTAVRLRDVETDETWELEADGVFVAIGHDPNTALFLDQLDHDDAGYLVTQAGSTETNVPGVFAVGDVQDHIYRQAVTAAGSGCMGALDAERYLAALEGHLMTAARARAPRLQPTPRVASVAMAEWIDLLDPSRDGAQREAPRRDPPRRALEQLLAPVTHDDEPRPRSKAARRRTSSGSCSPRSRAGRGGLLPGGRPDRHARGARHRPQDAGRRAGDRSRCPPGRVPARTTAGRSPTTRRRGRREASSTSSTSSTTRSTSSRTAASTSGLRSESASRLRQLRHEILRVRRTLGPTREALRKVVDNRVELDGRGGLPARGRARSSATPTTSSCAPPTGSTSRATCSPASRDYHQAKIANDQNEVMKRLTVIASLLLLPTFIVGLYGQNFQQLPGAPLAVRVLLVLGADRRHDDVPARGSSGASAGSRPPATLTACRTTSARTASSGPSTTTASRSWTTFRWRARAAASASCSS